MKHTLSKILFTAIIASSAHAHDFVPGPKQAQPLLFTNGIFHAAAGEQSGDMLVVDGKIAALGSDISTTTDAKIIDLKGKHVYPTFIALDTTLGLEEVEAVRATVDSYEVGFANPQLQAINAVNFDSELIPSIRSNGLGYALSVPRGQGLAGQSQLINLDSWGPEDGLVASAQRFHLYWPRPPRQTQDKEKQAQLEQRYQDNIDKVFESFDSAKRYANAVINNAQINYDGRWHSMLPLFKGEAKLFVHANKLEPIKHALGLQQKYGFGMVIVGGYDSWKVAQDLVEADIAVIYNKVLALPMRVDEPIDLPFKIPSLLHQNGVKFALGFDSAWNSRNLAYSAGQAINYGLPKEEGLKAITSHAAAILGADTIGSLAKGYAASFIISKGDPLDPLTANIESMYIDGRKVNLNNRHTQMVEKYRQR
ncbi:amidohydrolase family protein [Paraferrimonas sp. SM1919]|uniref:amidohydrolase family protein n=1 Tax=Paraferrimonas sp. SM1919 TaxID=2662263 RepID=UPI0013D806B2|nr:amidohydrolase family protein [Paraferrimonas sp. SM1919]